jgi:hypothetical protein
MLHMKQCAKVAGGGFGDLDNPSISKVAIFRDHLSAGVGNLNAFQIWQTDAAGLPPYRWTPVVTNGGLWNPSGLPAAISMCPSTIGSMSAVGGQSPPLKCWSQPLANLSASPQTTPGSEDQRTGLV